MSALVAALGWKTGKGLTGIAESVAYLWVLAAMFLLHPIASLFPNRLSEIAFGVAILSAAVGAVCIVHYSTEHVSASLSTVGIFWSVGEGIITRRPSLLKKTQREIFEYFKTNRASTPLATVLRHGSMLMIVASIVCLFTITTW